MGDPRFDAEHWHLPAEPLFGFIEIPAGPFMMGSDKRRDGQAYDDELPQHEASLPGYYVARWPVTVAQFAAFVRASGHKPGEPRSLKGIANHPVVYVTWHDAMAYCRWLNEQLQELARERLTIVVQSPPLKKGGEGGFPSRRPLEIPPDPPLGKGGGEGLRLAMANPLPESERRFWQGLADGSLGVGFPSEAEWEKAARGADGLIYPWGNELDPNRANCSDTGLNTTSTVGCFFGGASPYGCEEMSGNVWEWTRSLWSKDWDKLAFDYPYDPADGGENFDAPDKVRRVVRGGAFHVNPRFARCTFRLGSGSPGDRLGSSGFRVVASPFFSDR